MSRWVDDEGRCTVCGDWARDCDCRPCERCGDHFRMGDLDYLTPDDWDSPLWCEACREAGGAAQPPCSYCDAPITDGGGPYCDECLGRFYGRRPCVACGVSVAGGPTACPSCGCEAWTGDTGGAA